MTDRIDEYLPLPPAEQAAEWFLRWHSGELNIADRYQYLQWLKTSPVHIAETLRVCRLYSWLANAKLIVCPTNEDDFSNVVELSPRERAAPPTPRRTREWGGRLAAAFAMLCLTALLGLGAKVAWFDHTIHTQASEWRTLALHDGSIVSAGPRTQLRHEIGSTRRIVRVAQGEALFHVAKDPSRPFLVDAGIALIRATGTQFAVDRRAEWVLVTVSEGSVLVTQPGSAEAGVPLVAGEQIAVSKVAITEPRKVDVERALAWASRRLVFESNTVSAAVEEFNRRNRLQITVHPALGARDVRGVFAADDPRSFAEFLAQSTGGTLRGERPGVVHLGPGAKSSE